jgi:hypothetical protein
MRNRRTRLSYRQRVTAKDTMTSAAYFPGSGACQRTISQGTVKNE